jgi:Protein of unknown function (DUF1302)
MRENQLQGQFRKRIISVLMTIPLLVLQVTSVMALEADLGNDFNLSVDTTISYNSTWRVEEPATQLLPPAGSTGNANFKKNDQALSAFKSLIDFDLNWQEKYGAFVRGRGLYDTVYKDDDFRQETQDRHGQDVELLDAYAFANFEPAGLPVTLRAGRQSIFWGESLLVFGSIATAQNPLDVTQANAPAVEARELILPTGQVYGQISNTDSSLTLSSYYKWEWEASRLDEYGTYFSTNDALDDAGYMAMGIIPRGVDKDAKDGGEYGVALRYVMRNGDEFGLYYLNYHENMPLLNINNFLAPGMNYNLEYQENVRLAAATYSTVWGETNIGAEVSYRSNLKVAMATALPTYKEAELLQAQVSIYHGIGKIPYIAPNSVLAAEWGYNTVLDFKKDELAADKWATGGKFKFTLNYYDVLKGLDMDVPISLAWNPKGNTSYAISGFTENANSVGINFDFTYLGVYKAGIGYVAFMGDPDDNSKTDRDFVSLSLKYTF